MDGLPHNPGTDPHSDEAENAQAQRAVPSVGFSLIPSGRWPQFGFGFTLLLPLSLAFFMLFAFASIQFGFDQFWVFWAFPLFGLIAAVGLTATRKQRWFGIGVLAGLLFLGLLSGSCFLLLMFSSGPRV